MEPGILDDIVARDGVPFILQLLRSSSLGCIEEGLCFLFLFASKSYDNQVGWPEDSLRAAMCSSTFWVYCASSRVELDLFWVFL